MDHYTEVAQCGPPQSQICGQSGGFNVETDGPLFVEFQANANHCSDMIAHIAVDGNEWGAGRVGPGQRDGGYFIEVSPGVHNILVFAEGIEGGCNTGFVSAWGGTLHVETNDDALDGRG